MAQLMPLPLTVSCSSKIQIGFTFLVPAYPGCPGKEAVKWLYVCSKRPGVYFGLLLGGTGVHILSFSFVSGFRVTREIVDFRRKFIIFSAEVGQGTVAKILSLMGLGGPRTAHTKNWPPPLRTCEIGRLSAAW